jgi:HlyD family secretion protein
MKNFIKSKFFKSLILLFIVVISLNCAKDNTLNTNGFIEATTIDISPLISGKIEDISVNEGDFVNEGDILVKIEEDTYLSNLNLSESDLNRVKSGYISALNLFEQAKLDYERAKELKHKGTISQSQYDQAKTNYEVALANLNSQKATLKAAEEKISLAEINLDYTTLKAPISGIVDTINYEKGENVNFGSPVITLYDPNSKYIEVYISETNISRIKIGMNAEITVDSYPKKLFKGKVSFISNTAEFTPRNVQTKEERTNLVFKIRIDIEDPDNLLQVGIPADAEILNPIQNG